MNNENNFDAESYEVMPGDDIPNMDGPLSELESIGKRPEEIEEMAIKWNKDWDAQSYLIEEWKRCFKAYNNFEKAAKDRITIKTNEAWSIIQTQLPHIKKSIFALSRIVQANPKFAADENTRLKVEDFINKMILVSSKGEMKCADAIVDFLVFGTAIGKAYWHEETLFDIDMNQMLPDGTPNPNFRQWVESKLGKPDFENVDIFNFAVDPDNISHDIQNALWCRQRIFWRQQELKMLSEKGDIIELTDNMLEAGGNVESGKDIRDKMENKSAKSTGIDEKSSKCYIDEFWCKIYYKDEDGTQKSNDFVFWLLNNKKLVKFGKNEFKRKPFFVTRAYRDPNGFWGKGDVTIIKSLQEQMSAIWTQASLMAKKLGMKLTYIGQGGLVASTSLKRTEDGVVSVKDVNQIRPENTTAGNDLESLIKWLAILKQAIEDLTGVNSTLQGLMQEKGDQPATATEVSTLNNNSSARLEQKLDNFGFEYVSQIANHYFLLCKQFLDTYELHDRNSVITLTSEDFIGSYDWTCLGSISENNDAVRIKQLSDFTQQLITLSQATMQAVQAGVQITPLIIDPMPFVKDNIVPRFRIEDIDKYFILQQMPQSQPQQPGQPPVLDAPGKVWYTPPTPGQQPNGSAPVVNPVPVGVSPVMGSPTNNEPPASNTGAPTGQTAPMAPTSPVSMPNPTQIQGAALGIPQNMGPGTGQA